LVLDPGARGQLEHDVPQVGAVQPAQRQVIRQPEDPVDEEDLVGLAAVQERAAVTLDDGHLVPRQEAIGHGSVERPPVPEPVDGQLVADGRPPDRGHAASSAVTWPSPASTRVPGGQLLALSLSNSIRVPASSRTQRPGPNRCAKTAIRGASSSSIRARACGSSTTSRSTLSPLP